MTCRSHNKKSHTPTIVMGVLTGLTFLSGALLASPNTKADSSAGVNLSVTVPSACSLTITQDTLSTTIIPGNSGVIGTSTIQSICNDPAGLAVYAVGYTNDSYGNNTLTSTVGSNTYSIASHATTSGTPNNSEWNMTLTPVTGDYAPEIVTGYSGAHAIPDAYTKVAYRNAMTDMGNNATGANFTATFNAYIAGTQAAGTYTGKVKFLLVHPNVLTYDDQTGEPDTVQPATLAEDPEAPTFNNAYANAGKTKVGNYYQMKDMTGAICEAVASGQTSTLIDTRNNTTKTYSVAKLADGNCWMTQNLDFDIVAGTTYTPADTDIPANWTPTTSTYTTINTWDFSTTSPESYDPGDVYWNGALNIDWDESVYYMSSTGDSNYHLGNYYNWTAAIAMNDSSSYTNNGELVDQSICPAGWTLPRAGTGDDSFYQLFNDYNITTSSTNKAWNSPLYIALAGYYDGLVYRVGSGVGLWSSVAHASLNAYSPYLDADGSVDSSNSYYDRFIGASVRCIARPVSSTISGL